MGRIYTSLRGRKATTVTALFVYLIVACGAELFHTEDCPITTGKTAPASESCPACKFLAGANSTQVLHDAGPPALEYSLIPAPTPQISVVVSRHWAKSVLLRAPPSLSSS